MLGAIFFALYGLGVFLQADTLKESSTSACFPIDKIELVFVNAPAKSQKKFSYAKAIIKDFQAKHSCLGSKDIFDLLQKLQSTTIAKGYLSTRIALGSQSLSSGTLQITLSVGTISKILYNDEAHMWSFKKDFSIKEGDILDIRKVELGLRNLKNIESIESKIYFAPDEKFPNQSVVSIDTHKLSLPLFLGGGVDNGGSIGQNLQAFLYGSYENPLHLADKLSVYALASLPLSEKNHSYYFSMSYLVPIRRVHLSIDASYSHSAQEIPFVSITPVYQSRNINIDFKAKTLIYANSNSQLSVNVDGGVRLASSYLDTIALDVQSRNLADIALSVAYQRKIATFVFDISVGLLQGLPIFENQGKRLQAEYLYSVPNVNMYLNAPFRLWGTTLAYMSSIQTQISRDRLYASQKLSIGSRYTTRGFNHFSISGQMGVLYKNDLMVYLPDFWGIVIVPSVGMDWGFVRDLGSGGDKNGGILGGGGIGLSVLHRYFNTQIALNTPLYNPYKAPAQNLFFSIGGRW
ncbi:hypothetical protein BJI48_07175 [Helicobacter sp. 11S02596-1]|nr:hypothetical protein BJI48_07175 [Helicobacter sp. 11S02596-1]